MTPISAGPYEVKFTPENLSAILTRIKKGVPYAIACGTRKVSISCWYKWIWKGEQDIEDGLDTAHADLVQALREIESNTIEDDIEKIKETDRGHRGCEWELERRFWKYFSSHAQNIELNERVENLEKSKENK
jgi:hypothetical protein